MRAVCAIVDAFHFDTLEALEAINAAAQPALNCSATPALEDGTEAAGRLAVDSADAAEDRSASESDAEDGGEAAETSAVTADNGVSGSTSSAIALRRRQAEDIRSALLKRVLPALKTQLVGKGDVSFFTSSSYIPTTSRGSKPVHATIITSGHVQQCTACPVLDSMVKHIRLQ